MCTVLAPPILAPIWPWQAPGYWLAFAVTLVLVAVGCAVGIAGLRRQMAARRRRIGWVLLLAMTLCLIAGCSLNFVFALPASDALGTWQYQAMHVQGCSDPVWQPAFCPAFKTIKHRRATGGDLIATGTFLL